MMATKRVGGPEPSGRERVMPAAAESPLRLAHPQYGSASARGGRRPRLARPLRVERQWVTDRDAMVAALRVALGLPRVLPSHDEDAA